MPHHGKWSEAGIPHKGWVCADVEDLGLDRQVCEMCGKADIRFVHYLHHPDVLLQLAVGSHCAERLEEDPTAARKRDKSLKSIASRRERWGKRQWRLAQSGNLYLRDKGRVVIVFCTTGAYSALAKYPALDITVFSETPTTSLADAKEQAFDLLLELEKRLATSAHT